MSTIDELISKFYRIVILYPIYNGISHKLESKWKIVQNVRENPKKYPASYISKNGLFGLQQFNDEPIIELLTEYKSEHVEITVKLYRKRPDCWYIEKRKYDGHLLATLPDCPFGEKDESLYRLANNF